MLDSCKIKELIPHRYPFLMLDKVVEVTPDRALGEKRVTVNEPFFRGHFPNAPVMPGVLILECLVQLAWVMFAQRGPVQVRRVKRLKFRRSVIPGDCLELELTRSGLDEGLEKLRGVARLDGKVAVEGDLWVSIGEA